jgi:hypothetical protein
MTRESVRLHRFAIATVFETAQQAHSVEYRAMGERMQAALTDPPQPEEHPELRDTLRRIVPVAEWKRWGAAERGEWIRKYLVSYARRQRNNGRGAVPELPLVEAWARVLFPEGLPLSEPAVDGKARRGWLLDVIRIDEGTYG